jgi:hypothetical protein
LIIVSLFDNDFLTKIMAIGFLTIILMGVIEFAFKVEVMGEDKE